MRERENQAARATKRKVMRERERENQAARATKREVMREREI